MEKLTQVQIRIEKDLDEWLQKESNKHKVKKTHILKGILKSRVYGKEKIIIEVKHKNIISSRMVLRMKDKLENNRDLAAEYISKLTRLRSDDYKQKREIFIESIIRDMNRDLEDMETSMDKIELGLLRDAFIEKDDEKIKKLCDFDLRKWKFIITGKLFPNKLEQKVLEERIKEKMKKNKSGNSEMGLKK